MTRALKHIKNVFIMERNMDMKLEDLVLGQAKIRKCKDILVIRNKRLE